MRKLVGLFLLMLVSTMAFGQHKVTLSWTQSTSAGVTGNNVYRSTTTGGYYSKIYTSTTPIITYVDNNVVGSTTYYYVVTATCSACSPQESAYSNEVKAVIPADAQPLPPAGLTATPQ